MSAGERGFTMVELAIVLTISALLLPAVFLLQRTLESEHHRAITSVEAARAARTVSEELRADLRTLAWSKEDGDALALEGTGACASVRYELNGGVLARRAVPACGGTRALARNVESVSRHPWGLEIVFAADAGRGQPNRTRFRVGLP